MKNREINYLIDTPVSVRAINIRSCAPHWHDADIEVVYVLEGKINVVSAYDNFEIKAREFVVINHEDIHYLEGYDDNVTFIIHINLTHFINKYEYIMFMDLMCESFNTNLMQIKYTEQLKNLFIKTIIESTKSKGNNPEKIIYYANEILDIILNHFDIVHFYNDKPINENQLLRYYRIMKNIAENYGGKISMEAIAQEEYIGKNYTSQFWKRMMGINFTDYLNSRRTEIAQKLLLTTNLNLQEVSLKSGFSDTKYFYKNFKKWYGSTPFEHKKKYESMMNRGEDMLEETPPDIIFDKYNRQLINQLIAEQGDNIEASIHTNMNWRQDFEKSINLLGRRIKREIIKENQKVLGLKEIFLPLLDKHVVQISNQDIKVDWNFIGEVIKYAKEMNYVICIDIDYADREFREWESIINGFASFVFGVMGKEWLSRFKFYIFLTEANLDSEAEELVNRLSKIIDHKNIKVAVRYR
jgi:AraC-like DNA-binding protein